MSVIDIKKEVELAIKDMVTNSSTKYLMLKAVKLQRINPILKRVNVSYVGKIMSNVLHEYEEKGLIKILGIKRNHVSKFYVRINKSSYKKYAEKLKREEVIA